MRTIWLVYSQQDSEQPEVIYACQSSDRAQQIIVNLITARQEEKTEAHFAKDGLSGYIIIKPDDVLAYRAYAVSMSLLEA